MANTRYFASLASRHAFSQNLLKRESFVDRWLDSNPVSFLVFGFLSMMFLPVMYVMAMIVISVSL